MKDKIIEKKNEEIIYKIALYINKEFLNENIISYKTYKESETYILNKLNKNF